MLTGRTMWLAVLLIALVVGVLTGAMIILSTSPR
jgi:uncharacterized membrane-anchored protein YhcB (DUF1043 family)